MAVFFRNSSPTTTVLADGFTDDCLNSKYDNFRASRPYSRESLLSGTSLGSKVRLSQFSLLSRPDATLADDDDDDDHHHQRKEQKNLLQVSHPKSPPNPPTTQAHVLQMFAGQFSRNGSLEIADDNVSLASVINLAPPPTSILGKCKYYYDKYKLHRIAACVCLIAYSFLGAWLFYILEHEYEKEVKRQLFIEYEKKLVKVRLPECLDWDYWGALFYVGTLFTTIGYGNIAPRTASGRVLSVIYAIIGIPLVLAILSKCGKWLTKTLSMYWQQHRRRIKVKAKKTTNRLRGRRISNLDTLEIGLREEIEQPESRTIPIWLALLICVLFVCGCSSLFLIWETRWTFFTSLYFFCISLSTIGLGDIVPDHPHMFIIMFVLVILGLSIVSMFISVIQIKMEEWLYHLIKKIQQEYNRALESGECVDREGLFRNVMANEPTWMQLMAPTILTGQQTEKLEKKVEQFERLLKESKDVQTDMSVAYAATQVEKFEQSIACDPMTDRLIPQNRQTQWSSQCIDEYGGKKQLDVDAQSDDYRDSISDATSLPIDSTSLPVLKKQSKIRMVSDGAVQTDLAQFQIDEIAITLASLQTQRVRPPIVERSMATSAFLDSPLHSEIEQLGIVPQLSQADINMITEVMSNSFCKPSCGVENDSDQISTMDRSQLTSIQSSVNCRSFGTSPIPQISIMDDETQTSIRDKVDSTTDSKEPTILVDRTTLTEKMMESVSTETIQPEKLMVDRVSSPIHTNTRDHNTSPMLNQDSAEFDEQSTQTSIAEWFGKIFQKKGESQSEDLKKESEENSQGSSGCGSKKEEVGGMTSSVTMSTQYSPPPGFYLSEPHHRARSSSTSGMGTSIFEEETRQEVIVQTDDSYLKIARRLDEYRNNKTQFLPVCAAAPLGSKEVEPFKTDRPSERSHYYFGAKPRKSSLGRSRKKSRQEMRHGESQTGRSMDAEMLTEVLSSEKSRSISPKRPSSRTQLCRNPSLPIGISRGKVSDYVIKHEKGIPNPATNRQSPIKIIRQYSLDTDLH